MKILKKAIIKLKMNLKNYSPKTFKKRELIVLNKIDLIDKK